MREEPESRYKLDPEDKSDDQVQQDASMEFDNLGNQERIDKDHIQADMVSQQKSIDASHEENMTGFEMIEREFYSIIGASKEKNN